MPLQLIKIKFGGWLFNVFKLLSKFKFLRGTKLDPFGYLDERKKERELIRDYKQTIVDIGSKINKSNQKKEFLETTIQAILYFKSHEGYKFCYTKLKILIL